jgi:hypothetical protein
MSRSILGAVLLTAACAQAPAPAVGQPQPTATAALAAGAPAVASPATATPAPAAAPATVVKNQPPHVKLKLGHFVNRQHNIGLVIDLLSAKTENVADIDPARLRFDGDTRVYQLVGQHGGRGRIDFLNGKSVMLQVWEGGDMTVYVPDPDDGPSQELRVHRDGDADPL